MLIQDKMFLLQSMETECLLNNKPPNVVKFLVQLLLEEQLVFKNLALEKN